MDIQSEMINLWNLIVSYVRNDKRATEWMQIELSRRGKHFIHLNI